MTFEPLLIRTFPGARLDGVERLAGGYANDLFRVRLSGTAPPSVVVRAWRRDPGGAARELAVMRRAGEVVPVPRVLAADLVGERPLALLEEMPGLRADEALIRFPGEAGAIGAALGGTFARLQAIRFAAPGFFADETLRVSAFTGDAGENLLAYARPLVWNGAARAVLGAGLQRAWWRLIEGEAACLSGLETEASLVHADANPKNVLVTRHEDGWRVTALLDWEFALSGPSLMDLGNLLRFEDRAGTPFTSGVLGGWRGGGGPTSPDAVRQARTLDVYSLLGFVNAPGLLQAGVVALIRRQVGTGRL